jgi:hypothetical protein
MCCGSKRSALRNSGPLVRTPTTVVPVSQSAYPKNRAQIVPAENSAAPAAAAAPRSFTYVILQYTGSSAIRVRGPVTGREYGFSEAEHDCAVDPRDAAVLTRSRLFRRPGLPPTDHRSM